MKRPKVQSPQKTVEKNGPSTPGAVSVSERHLSKKLQGDIEEEGGQNGELVRKVTNAVLSLVHQETFSGPLPHPGHLAEYDHVLPGAADRILGMAEKEQAHRHEWEDQSLRFDFYYSVLGIVLGFLIALALLGLAYVSSQAGHQNVALAFLTASALGMVASFIHGRSWLKEKQSAPDETPETPPPPANSPKKRRR
jgi:uncharacterized membrane protein